jgi:hypothetical protein
VLVLLLGGRLSHGSEVGVHHARRGGGMPSVAGPAVTVDAQSRGHGDGIGGAGWLIG